MAIKNGGSTKYEQNIAINQAAVVGPGAPDGKVRIENADDWGYQPFPGLTAQLSDRAMLGVVYRAKADVDLKGDLNFRKLVIPQTGSESHRHQLGKSVPGMPELPLPGGRGQNRDIVSVLHTIALQSKMTNEPLILPAMKSTSCPHRISGRAAGNWIFRWV